MSRQPVAFTDEQLEQLLCEMVAEVLAHEDFDQFLTWMRANAQRHFGHLPFVDDGWAAGDGRNGCANVLESHALAGQRLQAAPGGRARPQ